MTASGSSPASQVLQERWCLPTKAGLCCALPEERIQSTDRLVPGWLEEAEVLWKGLLPFAEQPGEIREACTV